MYTIDDKKFIDLICKGISLDKLDRGLRNQHFINKEESLLQIVQTDLEILTECKTSNQEIADALDNLRKEIKNKTKICDSSKEYDRLTETEGKLVLKTLDTAYEIYSGVVVFRHGADARFCPWDNFAPKPLNIAESSNYLAKISRKDIDRKFIDFYKDFYLEYGKENALERFKYTIKDRSDPLTQAVVKIAQNSYPSLAEAEKFINSDPKDFEDYVTTIFSDNSHMIREHGLFPRNFGHKLNPRVLCKIFNLGIYKK